MIIIMVLYIQENNAQENKRKKASKNFLLSFLDFSETLFHYIAFLHTAKLLIEFKKDVDML
jgi:hypothetical protein